MLSLHNDPEEEAILQRERDAAEERGYPAWAADWSRKYRASQPRHWTIAERQAFYAGILEDTRPEWDYGPIYLMANEMRIGAAEPPSYTDSQIRRDERAEALEYTRRKTLGEVE